MMWYMVGRLYYVFACGSIWVGYKRYYLKKPPSFKMLRGINLILNSNN